MLTRIIGIFLMLAVAGGTASWPVAAQSADQAKLDRQTEKVKTKVRKLGLGERVRIKTKLYDETTYQGYVKEANENDFVIVDKLGSPHIVRYADVKSIGGGNLSTGAKIAIGIGIGIAATLAVIAILIAAYD